MRRVLLVLLAAAPALLLAESSTSPFKPHHLRWWAIQKVAKPPVPKVANPGLVHNEIDAFLLSKLEAAGLTYNPPADKRTLLRRVTIDLTGLPPTPEEIQAFLADDSPEAYEKVVDRLLASPHYGERWARHWLDVARYADSEGFKSDETRPHIWRYRDYVIRSLNADKPYDRFVKEQIAGDELYPGDRDALIATGFNRHFPDESNAANIMNRRQELLNDITDTVASAFLGVTVGCARCHDHKFDPILQKDYYRLQAFFANVRIEDEMVLDSEEEQARWERQNRIWEEKTRDLRQEIASLLEPVRKAFYEERLARFPEEIQAVLTMPPAERNPYQWQMYYKAKPQVTFTEEQLAARLKGEAKERYRQLKERLAAFDSFKPPEKSLAQVMIDASAEAPKTFVLRGGAWDAPLEEVQPGFLTILDPKPALIQKPAGMNTTGRRAALANWMANADNPLTARVAVNRVWHHHFGRGIVGTPADFGLMGERPTHRELLDYLAATFVEDGWSLKKLHRHIVLSRAYMQSSAPNEKAASVDPDNKLLWRFQRRRLEGEVIRDAALATAGLLNLKMFGPGVFPPRPEGTANKGAWKTEEDPEEMNRRSVYVFVRRNARYPLFESFDMPDTHESCSRRQQTLSVSQSLALLNDEMVLEWARAMAGRVLNDAGLSPDAQIQRAFRLALGREADSNEMSIARKFLDRHATLLSARFASGESPLLPGNFPEGADRAQAVALVDLCHVLLNSNEFLYLD